MTVPSTPKAAAPSARAHTRLLEIDGLRGLAALAVVIYHFTASHVELSGFVGRPSFALPWGKHGVEVFFVISGFVIFMTLERTRRPMDFIVSRFSRLYPAYWAAILFTTAVVHALGTAQFQLAPDEVLVNFTMLQRFPLIDAPNVDWSYWSLYTELLFYVAMLSLFMLGELRRIEVHQLAALALAWGYYWLASAVGQGTVPDSFAARTLVRNMETVLPYAPYFVIGISIHRIWRGQRPRSAVLVLALAYATIAATLTAWQLAAAAIAVAAFGAILTGRAAVLRIRPLLWLGAISYSLYLVHNIAGRAIIFRLEQAGWEFDAAVLAATLASVAVAAAITLLIERPAIRAIRDHYRRHREAPGAFERPPRARVVRG